MGNHCVRPHSTDEAKAYIPVPPSTDKVEVLRSRLKSEFGVQSRLIGKQLEVVGICSNVAKAQEFTLRFLRAEKSYMVHVTKECASIFSVRSLVEHFEQTYKIIVCVIDQKTILLKDLTCNVDRFEYLLREIEVNCQKQPLFDMATRDCELFSWCIRFSVKFGELPSKQSVRNALLQYFSQTYGSSLENSTEASPIAKSTQSPVRLSKQDSKMNEKRAQLATNVFAIPKPHEHVLETSKSPRNQAPFRKLPGVVNSTSVSVQTSMRRKRHLLRKKRKKAKSQMPPMGNLRPVVIDGSNVAYTHGRHKKFSPEGVHLAIQYFLDQGCSNVIAVVPRFRQRVGGELFDQLERSGHLCYSPSRTVNNRQQSSDDDKIVLRLAIENNAVVVSNDKYRSYRNLNEQYRDLIDNRLLQYTIAWDTFMIAEDPHGPQGRSLLECLRFPMELED